MIQVKGGRIVMSGTEDEILSESTAVLHGVYEQLVRWHGEEDALDKLATMGRLAIMSEVELANEAKRKLQELKDLLEKEETDE